MMTLQSRLRELVEAVVYRKDFKELKKSILLLREPKKPTREKHSIIFSRIEPPHPEDTAVRHGKIPLKELQGLLRNGNVNDHQILIPDFYSDFKVRHGLKCLFDPEKPYPKFNPFDDKPIVAQLPLDFGTRITMTVDISFPARILKEMFEIEIKSLKKRWRLKEERKERYSDDEIFKVKKLIEEGSGQTEIYKKLYPEQPSDFTYGVPKGSHHEKVDGWNKYQRVGRLMKKAKTLKR